MRNRAGDALLLSLPLPGTVAAIQRRIREFGLEGVLAKRRHSLYRPGERADAWQQAGEKIRRVVAATKILGSEQVP